MQKIFLCCVLAISVINAQNPAPRFKIDGSRIKDMSNTFISEDTAIGSAVYTLEGFDPPPNETPVTFGIQSDAFQVKDPNTGVVTLIRKLDHETEAKFKVTTSISDGTNNVRHDVTITILDANDEKPTFTKETYKVEIFENETVGFIVQDLSVTDVDTVNGMLSVTCDDTLTGVVHEGACTTFQLRITNRDNQKWKGQLILILPLDYELKNSYQYPLLVFDGKNYGVSSIEITIVDVDDTPPSFIRAVGVTINEGQPAGRSIEYVVAIDGDTARRDIRYEFIDGANPGNMFTIDPVKGNITTRVIIDRESSFLATGTVSLGIRAREVISSGPPEVLGNDAQTTATATIQIQVLDINDNRPQFNPNVYDVEIYEDIANNSILPTLLLTVSDIDQGNAASYSLTLQDHTDVFYIVPDSGVGFSNPAIKVKNTDLIDYDLGPKRYILHVLATETTAVGQFGGATIDITVLDVNDNRPTFDQPRYKKSIPEDSTGGVFVVTVIVADPDSGNYGLAGIVYTLLGTGANLFILDEKSGTVTVAHCPTPGRGECLDYERVKSYELTVAAQDENGLGFAVTVPLIIDITDVNDNAPRFILRNYVSYINETEQRPVPEIRIEAFDPDVAGGPLRYTIESQTVLGLFRLEDVGNARSVVAVRPVEYRTTRDNLGRFYLTVHVTDGRNSDTSEVMIIVLDINDNAPSFAPDVYTEEISELTRGGVFIINITATDIDSSTSASGQIMYSIDSGSQTKFEVNDASGVIRTAADATFDFDSQSRYTLIMLARDKGQPQKTGTATVFIIILDENNKMPYFTPSTQRADIFENQPNGTFVTTVNADDQDSNSILEYTFEGQKRAYNRDGVEVIGGTYDFTNLFSIDKNTGSVYVAADLNRDKVALVTYGMVVTDVNVASTIRQTGTGTIIIRILEYNSEPPEFIAPWNITHKYYNITIREEQDVGTFVMSLIAKDSHSSISEYRIIEDPLNFFDVSAQSGVVSISRRIDYDLPSSPSETEFLAMAWDSGIPILSASAMVYVTILNINDNSPVFLEAGYSRQVDENFSDLSAVLVTIRATDKDKEDYGEVRYTISDPLNRFWIDNLSGNVYLQPGAVLDREITPLIAIQVQAYDSPLDANVRRSNTAPLYFRLNDENDNPPIFTQLNYETSIIETIPLGRQILQLFATDADTGKNGYVLYSNSSSIYQDLFDVSDNGVITVAASLRGKAGIYRFSASATDEWRKHIVYAGITINVIEATNTQPQWRIPPRANMSTEVLESQYLGMLVYDVHAEDGDKGSNGIIDYGFYYDGQYTNRTPEFRMNRVTGVIRAEIVYDREAVDRYTLLLVARDQGEPFLENTRFLSVIVLDVNDNIPRFPTRPDGETVIEDIIVPENAEAGQFIGQVEAYDPDRPDDATSAVIFYYIISGNEEGLFRVDRLTGDIYINAPLDREKTSSFILYIQASNDENDDTVIRSRRRRAADPSIVTVRITIGDVNDNSPVFDTKTYYGCISTEDPFDQTILRVTAKDRDSTDVVYYSIKPDDNSVDASNMFAVHPQSGILSNRILMGNNPEQTFSIRLTASDLTNEDKATALVFVTSLSERTKLVVKQPPEDVRLFIEQIRSMLKRVLDDKTGGNAKHVVCIDSITDHTEGDVIISQWSDVYIYVTKNETKDQYRVYDSLTLSSIITDLIADENLKDEFDSLYINNAQGNAQQQQDWLPVMVVMVIIFVAIFLAILLICVCCYIIRREKRNKLKKVSQIRSAHPMTIQPVIEPQEYDNQDQSEYATVQKKVPPSDAVFIADPDPEPPRVPTPEPELPTEEPMDTEFHPDTDSDDDDMNRYSPPSQPSTPRNDTARRPTPEPTNDDEFRIETVLI